ncbi:hypothetical protein [Methylobacterium sp. ID0610]|uniref:hypothetical protein n=1 Tax=Methylobacterium carpenticola TaxID=3344827 RepID=UPI00368446F0
MAAASRTTARALAAARLSAAYDAWCSAERYLDEVTVALHAGDTGLSRTGASDDAVIREARERAFAARRAYDTLRFELLTPEEHSLTPNDEDDMASALRLRLRANEDAEADVAGVDFLTAGRDEYVLQVTGRGL